MIQVPQVETEYDKEFDILYILVGKPTFAEAESIIEDVYIRRDMHSEKIAGAIIENYSTKNRTILSEILPLKLGQYLPNI